jgi:hypothetical protein
MSSCATGHRVARIPWDRHVPYPLTRAPLGLNILYPIQILLIILPSTKFFLYFTVVLLQKYPLSIQKVRLPHSLFRLELRLQCGRFQEPEPKQGDQPESWAQEVRYSVGTAVCTHRKAATRSLCRTSLCTNSLDERQQMSWVFCLLSFNPTLCFNIRLIFKLKACVGTMCSFS